jgi:cullin 2
MVADHLPALHAESRVMVAQDKRKDLGNMYKLLKPIEKGLVILVKEIQEHITRSGLEAVNNIPSSGENMAQVFVEMVLDVHKKYNDLIRDVFNSDQQFTSALDKACSTIVNHRKNPKLPCRSPELLARYCDALLKKSLKGTNENEIDDKLSLSITVFKYIDDKDVFQKFYAKMFAKRLIHSQSLSMESEEAMINKLKNACGYEFTSKLHRMFTDIKLSDDLNEAFNAWERENKVDTGLGLSFSIFVLQAGAWPLGQSAISPFALPQPFEKPLSHFEMFYNRKFNGRKLTWLHHLSTTDVKMSFPDNKSVSKKTYIVSMGTYHMAILFTFESSDSMTFKELQEHTKLSDEQLVKHLQSLIDAKIILVPELIAGISRTSIDLSPASPVYEPPNSPSPSSPSLLTTKEDSPKPAIVLTDPSPSTLFKLNLEFTHRRTKFKITAVSQKEIQQVSAMLFLN